MELFEMSFVSFDWDDQFLICVDVMLPFVLLVDAEIIGESIFIFNNMALTKNFLNLDSNNKKM